MRYVVERYCSDLELTQIQRQIHMVRMLDALEHGLRLPPGWILRIVQIRQVCRRMIVVSAR